MSDNPAVTDTLGWIYCKKQAYGQAIGLLKESLEHLEDNPTVHYHLGVAYYKSGDAKQVRTTLRRALQLSQNFEGAEAHTALQTLP